MAKQVKVKTVSNYCHYQHKYRVDKYRYAEYEQHIFQYKIAADYYYNTECKLDCADYPVFVEQLRLNRRH